MNINESLNLPTYGGRYFYPTVLHAAALSGSLYYGNSAQPQLTGSTTLSLMLAPSANTSLQLLAGDSIYAGGYVVSQAGTDSSPIATPERPAFLGTPGNGRPGPTTSAVTCRPQPISSRCTASGSTVIRPMVRGHWHPRASMPWTAISSVSIPANSFVSPPAG